MLSTFAAGMSTAVGAMLLHYEILRVLCCLAPKLRNPPRLRMLLVIVGALFAHLAEIGLFAGTLWMLGHMPECRLAGVGPGIPLDQALFVSLESFSSLGSSAAYPIGPIRLFAGIESLTGLLLIGWTTAYSYLAMSEFWSHH